MKPTITNEFTYNNIFGNGIIYDNWNSNAFYYG